MTAYTSISNALVAVGAKPFATTIQALRDNPIAIGEADPSVPLALLHVGLLATLTTTSGASVASGTLDLTNYKLMRIVFDGVSHNDGVSRNITIGGVTIAASVAASGTFRGVMEIDLADGQGWFAVASMNASTGTTATATLTLCNTDITTASTSITIAVSGGAFDGGAVRIYGLK